MSKNASSEDLITAINDHLLETETQVLRLEQVFELLGKTARAKKCEAMDGLIKEGHKIAEDTQPGPVRDAGIISANQKIEHYEIASYGTLVAFSNPLQETEVADILAETFNEEKIADQKLTQVAVSAINLEAAEPEDEEA